MDALATLKALKDKLKKEKEEVAGNSKYVKRSVLEEARLKRLREEEERERQEKEKKRKLQESTRQKPLERTVSSSSQDQEELLPRAEVIRRLRALGQPATLFGEEDVDRMQRLRKAEKEMILEDELRGGAQINTLNELKRQEKLEKLKKSQPGEGPSKKDAEGSAAEEQQADKADAPPKDPLVAAFEAAAARVAEQQAEQSMSISDRISKYLRLWSKEWEADMEARPEEVKLSGPGQQATKMYKQTMMYLEPLYSRLERGQVDEELRNGIWMMVRYMRGRNYLAANDVYLKLAIGNAPWPIGVTSVGIHERSAREKISHVMNESGQAHIMNDEATRKYLQAMKRMITFVQRRYPTDPSRCVDFTTVADASRGTTGAGSDKLALLEAEAKEGNWRALGLPAAPHFMEADGSVKVPPKWENVISRALDGESITPPLLRTPPKTPPATPPPPEQDKQHPPPH